MSTTTTKNEYIVILPDHAKSLSKRLAVRPAHFAGLKADVEAGDIVFGGATLAKHGAEGEQPDMNGSVMLIKAESEEKVWERIKKDPYAEGGVWNVDEVRVMPFKCAIRTAM